MKNESIRYITMKDLVSITLSSNASTGYVWKFVSVDNFELVDMRPLKQYDFEEMGIGSPIDMVYTVKPKQPGQFVLRFEKRRPWEKKTDPIDLHEEVVMVEE